MEMIAAVWEGLCVPVATTTGTATSAAAAATE